MRGAGAIPASQPSPPCPSLSPAKLAQVARRLGLSPILVLVPARWQHRTWLAKDDQLRRATSILYEAARTGRPLSATEGARRAGCSRATWHSYVHRAVEQGWLVAHTEKASPNGWMTTSRYEVVWTEDLAGCLNERWRTLLTLAWECLQQDAATEAQVKGWICWQGSNGISRLERALKRQIRSRIENPNRENQDRGTPRLRTGKSRNLPHLVQLADRLFMGVEKQQGSFR